MVSIVLPFLLKVGTQFYHPMAIWNAPIIVVKCSKIGLCYQDCGCKMIWKKITTLIYSAPMYQKSVAQKSCGLYSKRWKDEKQYTDEKIIQVQKQESNALVHVPFINLK
jgi:hypothetical protein